MIGNKYDGLYQHCWKKISYSGVKQETQISSGGVTISSTGKAQTIYYSKSVKLVGGEPALVDPQSISITDTNPASLAALAPVYISNLFGDVSGVYYLPQGTTSGTNAGYTISVISSTKNVLLRPDSPVTAKKVTYSPVSVTVEFVFSTNRNQYPDSGIVGDYEYQYVGIPFENAACASKIVTGSYRGTGMNATVVTLPAAPKLVLLFGRNESYGSCLYGLLPTGTTWVVGGEYGGDTSNIKLNGSAITATSSWGNVSNYTYYYAAFI